MAEFENQSFSNALLATLGDLAASTFYACTFENVDFSLLASAKRLRFLECRFKQCNLSNLKVMAFSFKEARFVGCKLVGINWAACAAFENPDFQDCKLDLSTFQGLPLKNLKCLECTANEVDFSGAHLAGADFSGTLLRGSSFNGADLSAADFRGAKEYSINPLTCKVKGARFRYPDVTTLLSALGIKVEF